MLLDGELGKPQVHPAVLSWYRIFVYQRACDVLKARTKETRRARLIQVPEHMREDVESEARRLWRLRHAT